MSASFHDVAHASLPVALVLLILAAAARGVLWARVEDPRAARLARQYVDPLSTWCLIALGTHTVALGAAGEAGVLSLALAVGLGAAAVLLRLAPEADQPSPVEPDEPPATAAPAPSPAGPLWARPVGEHSRRRT